MKQFFKFGDGEKIKSLRKVYIPIKIGEKDVMLQTDAVNTEIPLLLSEASNEMRQWNYKF